MRQPPAPDRPREKLGRVGCAALGDNELLALVIGSGSARASALDLANALLGGAGGLHALARMSADELRRVPGVGVARAAQVASAIELGRRALAPPTRERMRLSSPREVAALLLPEFGGRPTEQFGVLLLDARHRALRTVVVSTGTLDASVVHPRDVFRPAAVAGAAALVLFHNHPSGDPTPSREDVDLTRRMSAAGELMGVEVIDHVILGDGRYASFRESGRL